MRIDFGDPADGLEEGPWEAFFESFDKSHLALLVSQEAESRFNKFIARD